VTESTSAIHVQNLRKVYREGWLFPKKFEALKGVSLTVNRGEIFGLLGPNGAGKTTLLKILLGIIGKSAGAASLLGLPAGSKAARQLVGYLPEHLRIPAHLTAYTALECYGNLSNLPNRVIRQRRDTLIDLVGLTGRANEKVKRFSKGMLQRLGLAQALLHQPQMLILDEPTDGLDPRARAEMRTIIKRQRDRGVTIFLNSHLLQEVELVCDRVAILNRGELLYCGRVDEVGRQISQVPGANDVVFVVRGDRTHIDAAFQGQPFDVEPGRQEHEYEVTIYSSNQPMIDRQVDALRKYELSLIELRRKQVSLEDAFLALVEKET
jgi:ABC-2 type transport system ATP-binding protein